MTETPLDHARHLVAQIQDSATPAEWYQSLAFIVGALMCLKWDRELDVGFSDPGAGQRLALVDSVMEVIKAGPQKGRRPSKHGPRIDAVVCQDLLRKSLGKPVPSRAEATAFFELHEYEKRSDLRDEETRRKRARAAAEKRVDAAVARGGLKVATRPKRK